MPGITIPNLILTDEWGPNDPEVESVWMLLKDASSKLADPIMADELDFRADRIYEKLREARGYYKTITSDTFQSSPTSNQEAIYGSLYGALWSAYKDRLVKFLKVVGYEAGAIVSGDTQYESQMQSFATRYPELAWLKPYINKQKIAWQDTLRDYRNSQEHDGDLRDNLNLPDINNPLAAKDIFISVSDAVEAIAVSAVSYKLPDYWSVVPIDETATVFDRRPRFKIEIVTRTNKEAER